MGTHPAAFVALDRWAGALYIMHMATACTAFALLGAGSLLARDLPSWAGWLGVGWGLSFAVGVPGVAGRYRTVLRMALASGMTVVLPCRSWQ